MSRPADTSRTRTRPARVRPSGLCFAVLLLAAAAAGQSATYRPWFADAALKGVDSLVVGRIKNVSALGNRDRVVRITVDRCLFGEAPDEIVLLGAPESLLAWREMQKLLFLEKRLDGRAWRLSDHVDLPAEEARTRIEFLGRLLEAGRERIDGRPVAEAQRLQEVFAVIVHDKASPSAWVRRILVRELERIVATRRERIDSNRLSELAGFRDSDLDAADARLLQNLILELEESNALRWTRDDLLFADGEAREAFLRDYGLFQSGGLPGERRLRFLDDVVERFGRRAAPLVARALEDDDPALRRRSIHWLGEFESGAALEKLMQIAEGRVRVSTGVIPADVEESRAALEALRKISAEKMLRRLQALVGMPELRVEAYTAIAALGTGEARLFLEDQHERLKRDPESDADLRLLLTQLRSEEFARNEARLHAERSRRFAR